jgi:hypothetical protein
VHLITCKLCGKVFTSNSGKVCPQCLEELDDLYPRVREFLRDHASQEYNAEELAEEVGVDIRYIQALIDLKYIERNVSSEEEEQKKRERLLKEFQKNLDEGKRRSTSTETTRTYGQERYGEKGRKP